MNKSLHLTIEKALAIPIDSSRLPVLNELIVYIKAKLNQNEPIQLNFICTHNSRRSQLSQIWAKTAALYNGIHIDSYSGGVEVTAFNERAVASCKRMGFDITSDNEADNPKYTIQLVNEQLLCFSKVYDHQANPNSGFAAIMTCSDADENCPYIPGAEVRIPLRYNDPKAFDNSRLEAEKYDERSLQIASELLFVFRSVAVA